MAKRQSRTILLIFITLWFLIAFFRTFFNLSKLITEEPRWYFLSTEEKKEKQFGEMHLFFRFAQKIVPPRSNILLYTENGMAYYLSRYYFYPTTVIWGERQFTEWNNDINRNYTYVLYFLPVNELSDTVMVNNITYKKLKVFKYNNVEAGSIYIK